MSKTKWYAKPLCHCERSVAILIALALVLSLAVVAVPMAGTAEANSPVTNIDTGETFSTIQAAIDDPGTLDGHTIEVAAGTYDLESSIKVDKSVSIIGDPSNPGNVVINCATIVNKQSSNYPSQSWLWERDRDGFQVAANNVVIKGFKIVDALTVVGGEGDGWQNAGITVGGDVTLLDWLDPYNVPLLIDGGTFSNNIIEHCSHGVYLSMSKNVVVSNNIIRNSINVPGREPYDGNGITNWNTQIWGTYQDPTGNTIEGNLIENCEEKGILIGAWAEDFSASGTVITNNTIRDSQKGVGIALMYIAGPLSITGNNIYSNPTGIGVGPEVSDVEAHFNNIYNNANFGADVWDWTGTASLDAINNWWGHASGPSGENGRVNKKDKVIGKGDAVSANVEWDPWLPQPVKHTKHDPLPPGLLR